MLRNTGPRKLVEVRRSGSASVGVTNTATIIIDGRHFVYLVHVHTYYLASDLLLLLLHSRHNGSPLVRNQSKSHLGASGPRRGAIVDRATNWGADGG